MYPFALHHIRFVSVDIAIIGRVLFGVLLGVQGGLLPLLVTLAAAVPYFFFLQGTLEANSGVTGAGQMCATPQRMYFAGAAAALECLIVLWLSTRAV